MSKISKEKFVFFKRDKRNAIFIGEKKKETKCVGLWNSNSILTENHGDNFFTIFQQ